MITKIDHMIAGAALGGSIAAYAQNNLSTGTFVLICICSTCLAIRNLIQQHQEDVH